MRDYQESVTTRQTDAGQSDPYVSLCFAGDTTKDVLIGKYQTPNLKLQGMTYHTIALSCIMHHFT